ncbi:MAG: hypothetical protein IPO36_18420 [Anaerolineales bacterium]|nr:hypothetical protein [Anaerolineales bacterium]
MLPQVGLAVLFPIPSSGSVSRLELDSSVVSERLACASSISITEVFWAGAGLKD